MVHIPEIRSINSMCPNCDTKFGYLVENNSVTCPMCKWTQSLPIIKIDPQEYLCIPCKVDFTVADEHAVVCPECHSPVSWRVET